MSYGISTKLDLVYEDAVDKVKDALQKEGFGVLTTIDIRDTLRQKLNAEFRKYIILGACNPPLAHRALQAELEIGLLLPCNVVVYESDAGETIVSAVDPVSAMGSAESPALKAIAEEVRGKLNNVIQSLH